MRISRPSVRTSSAFTLSAIRSAGAPAARNTLPTSRGLTPTAKDLPSLGRTICASCSAVSVRAPTVNDRAAGVMGTNFGSARAPAAAPRPTNAASRIAVRMTTPMPVDGGCATMVAVPWHSGFLGSSMPQSHDRRGVLKAGAALIAAPLLLLPARAAEPAWPTQTVGPFIEVEINSGRIRGGHSRGALAFKGIPYAGSVSGRNRFKEAPKVTPWTGVRDATRLGPPAMQGPGTTYGEHEPACSEDCLVLNVWTPAVRDGGRRPVMFYCHGGGFTAGSGGQNIQDGAHLAATYDVVVVASNHRLGLFGYLYLGELGGSEYATSGNQGMLDIVAALSWVKENIATFGGDPGNVMVFGESGGGF